jgi:hypothetical protein
MSQLFWYLINKENMLIEIRNTLIFNLKLLGNIPLCYNKCHRSVTVQKKVKLAGLVEYGV